MPKKTTEVSFWDRMRNLFFKPMEFFESVKTEQGITNALLTYAAFGLIATIGGIFSPFNMWGLMGMRSFGGPDYFSWIIPIFAAAGFVFGIVMTFFYSVLIHAFVIVFEGKADYYATYRAYAYSMVPSLLIGVIPFFGGLGFIYSLVLLVIGVMKVNELSVGKAVLAALLPLAIMLLLLIGMLVSAIFLFSRRMFY